MRPGLRRGMLVGLLVAAVGVALAALPALDVFDRRLSAYGSGGSDLSLTLALASDNVGYRAQSALASAGSVGLLDEPASVVVAVFGAERGFTPDEVQKLEAFMLEGGIVLVADEADNAVALTARHGVRVQPGTLLRAAGDEASDVVETTLFGARFQMVAARALEIDEEAATAPEVLALAPPDTVRDVNGNRVVDPEGDPQGEYPLVVRVPVGAGALYVFGDVTAFTNGLLEQGANVPAILALWNALAEGRTTIVVDESRHVQGAGEAVSTPVRSLVAAAGVPFAPLILAIGLGLGLLLSRRAGADEVTAHAPQLDAPLAALHAGTPREGTR